jgi:sarcosine oxidase subunit gamma
MADTLQRTSPLEPWAGRFAELSDSVSIAEEPLVTMVELRADASGVDAVTGVLGIEPPTAASTYAKGTDTTVIWLGPDEWLVTGTQLAGADLEARLREALAPHGGSAVDVSAQRTTLRLRGRHSRDVLSKGCAIDVHPTKFGEGAAVQTTLGRTGIVLLAVDDSGADYRILVRSSFARYLADWLLDAAQEYSL